MSEEKKLDVTYTLMRVPAVFDALASIGSVPLSAKLAYRLQKVMVPIQDAMKRLAKVKDDLVEKLGVPVDGKKGAFEITPASENFSKYTDELKELLEEEITISTRRVLLPPEAEVQAVALNTLIDFVGVKGEDDDEEAEATGPTEVVKAE